MRAGILLSVAGHAALLLWVLVLIGHPTPFRTVPPDIWVPLKLRTRASDKGLGDFFFGLEARLTMATVSSPVCLPTTCKALQRKVRASQRLMN